MARERLVALAIAELMTDLGADVAPPPAVPATDPEPAVAQAEPEPEPEPIEVPAPVARPFRLTLSGFAYGTTLAHPLREELGAGARFDAHASRFGVAGFVSGGRARVSTELGDVTAGEITLGAEGLVVIRRARFEVAGAAGARLGLAVLRGRASDPTETAGRAFRAPILAPHVALRMSVHATDRVSLHFGLEAAYLVVRAHALVAGARSVSFDGPTLSLSVGVGLALGSGRGE